MTMACSLFTEREKREQLERIEYEDKAAREMLYEAIKASYESPYVKINSSHAGGIGSSPSIPVRVETSYQFLRAMLRIIGKSEEGLGCGAYTLRSTPQPPQP